MLEVKHAFRRPKTPKIPTVLVRKLAKEWPWCHLANLLKTVQFGKKHFVVDIAFFHFFFGCCCCPYRGSGRVVLWVSPKKSLRLLFPALHPALWRRILWFPRLLKPGHGINQWEMWPKIWSGQPATSASGLDPKRKILGDLATWWLEDHPASFLGFVLFFD